MEPVKLNRAALLSSAAAWAIALQLPARADGPSDGGVSASDALERLEEGNERFVSGKLRNPSNLVERRTALAGGQAPWVTILACSDSRTPPELIFDSDVGELFVVRLAGNYVTNDGLGTMEYGFSALGSNLIVVLGHANCGAVKATYDSLKTSKPLPPHLDALSAAIGPGIESVVRKNGSLSDAIKANVRAQVAATSSRSSVLAGGVAAKKLKIVGATYSLKKGIVTFL